MMPELLEMAKLVRSAVEGMPLRERSEPAGPGALGNPTTRVDKAAEDCVFRFLAERGIPLNVLSEEAGFIDRGSAETLVLDPVDGTFNCHSGMPFYSVSLAVGSRSLSGMREGLVMNLATGDAYTAVRGEGAFLNGKPIRVREPPGDLVMLAYLGSPSLSHAREVASRFRRVRCLGSVALDLCMVASGAADAFLIEYADEGRSIRVVDIAAALLILREAGGEAWDANKQILDMPLSLEERRNMMAASNAGLLELMR